MWLRLYYALYFLQIVEMNTGKILGQNTVGKLFVHSPYLMKGYLIHKDKEVISSKHNLTKF